MLLAYHFAKSQNHIYWIEFYLFAMISLIMNNDKYTNYDSWIILNILVTYLLLLFTYFNTLLLTVCTVYMYYIVSRL